MNKINHEVSVSKVIIRLDKDHKTQNEGGDHGFFFLVFGFLGFFWFVCFVLFCCYKTKQDFYDISINSV